MTSHAFGAAFALLSLANGLCAQSLEQRVALAAPDARVQLVYAARPEVCGNGRSFIQVGSSQWYGAWSSDMDRRDVCAAGPVRVVLDRAGRQVVTISTYAGPLPALEAGVVDLGRVRAADAADFFLLLAERGEGRVGRDALLPAMLADSVDVTTRLLAIASNQNGSRETRRSAISWLVRPADAGGRFAAGVLDALVSIAKDEDDNQSVRQSGLRALGRLDHGAGLGALTSLARDANRAWLAREALGALASSGDPRARQYLRDLVTRGDQPDDLLAAAVRGLGGEYATGTDIKLLRDSYAKLPGERSREAALNAVGNFGGADNLRWLLALSTDGDQAMNTRRRAIRQAYKAGASTADVVRVYDSSTDPEIKDTILGALAENGDRQATDKLMAVARSDDNAQRRRKAINVLSQSSDERVKKFLLEMAAR